MTLRELHILIAPDELTVTVTDQEGAELARLDAHHGAVNVAEPALVALVVDTYREALA